MESFNLKQAIYNASSYKQPIIFLHQCKLQKESMKKNSGNHD
jgi:hypothetical protein